MQLEDLLSTLSKRVEIGVQQKQGLYCEGSAAYARSYNSILKIAKDAFKVDPVFEESVRDMVEVEEARADSVMEEVLALGSKLRGLCRTFVIVHMSPKEKERIGFHS